MPKDTTQLLTDLCEKLGFCLPPKPRARLTRNPPQELDSFVRAVFVAEGLDPEIAEKHLLRQVRDLCRPYFD